MAPPVWVGQAGQSKASFLPVPVCRLLSGSVDRGRLALYFTGSRVSVGPPQITQPRKVLTAAPSCLGFSYFCVNEGVHTCHRAHVRSDKLVCSYRVVPWDQLHLSVWQQASLSTKPSRWLQALLCPQWSVLPFPPTDCPPED